MTGVRVKVCGITRAEDAVLAATLGAWAIGFVFAESPRRVTPAHARKLAAGLRAAEPGGGAPLVVGVFVDGPAERIAGIAGEVGLDAVQLHSAAPGAAAVRAALGERAADTLIIQAVPVSADAAGPEAVAGAVTCVRAGADLLLFDTRSAGRFGGTGTPFPWDLARAAGDAPFLVAGGLGPENAAEALAVSGAMGVDVSSGVESAPGIKDAGRLRALFAAFGETDATVGGGVPPAAPHNG